MYTENEFRDRFWNLDPLEIIARLLLRFRKMVTLKNLKTLPRKLQWVL